MDETSSKVGKTTGDDYNAAAPKGSSTEAAKKNGDGGDDGAVVATEAEGKGGGYKVETEEENVPKDKRDGRKGAKEEAVAASGADKDAADGGGGDKIGRKSKRKSLDSPQAAAPAVANPGSAEGVGGREKRARKTLKAYVPEDFTKVDRSVHISQGRGRKIGDLKVVRDSIENCKDQALAELAHKILFGGNKKPPKDSLKTNLLAFSGYLPPKPEGVTEKELEAMDKKVESKMGEKAFNLKVGEIRDLCDFFALDRFGISHKADLIDLLLDFLSQPSNDRVKGSNHKGKSKDKSSIKRESSGSKEEEHSFEGEDGSDDDEEGEAKPRKTKKGKGVADLFSIQKGKMPSDSTLREWVRCFVQCYDLDKASIKVALEVAGDKFGVDMTNKKDRLKEMLADAMQ